MTYGSIVNMATAQAGDINQNGIDYCKLKTCAYNSFAAMWGLTVIDIILVAG